jgi:dihydropyrimidine dehydrogenase (NAD+) subunit PreA
MANLNTTICGINSPNPFWLASSPVTNTGEQIMRAFDQGWGGAVWKTISSPAVNPSPRLGKFTHNNSFIGMNNIEIFSERSIETNFKDVAAVKKQYPKNALLVSIGAANQQEWIELTKRAEDAGADGVELNFSCPHGAPEAGMGCAIGQNASLVQELMALVKSHTKLPVFAKLTPVVTDINIPAKAAKAGGADGLALINTIPSIIGVDIETLQGQPNVAGKFTNGGYCGPAIKPIALYMVASLARNREINLPISGMGGISCWQDAVEFFALGATTVQVCTAVMHNGYGIIEKMLAGLNQYLAEHKFSSINDLIGSAVENFIPWHELDLNSKVVADIDESKCIACQKCYHACLDGGYQCIHTSVTPCHANHDEIVDFDKPVLSVAPTQIHHNNKNIPVINKKRCTGCGLCTLVCPVNCINLIVAAGPAFNNYKL